MTKDEKLLSEALDTLLATDCLFWACEGPTLRRKAMVTCNRCAMIGKLAKRLGKWSDELQEARGNAPTYVAWIGS